jgi:hypothetical protein
MFPQNNQRLDIFEAKKQTNNSWEKNNNTTQKD